MIYTTDRYNITVDIDNRRTGKTYRMIQDIINYIISNNLHTAYVFCVNYQMYSNIIDKCIDILIDDRMGNIQINDPSFEMYYNTIEMQTQGIINDRIKTTSIRNIQLIDNRENNIKFYFDEYDLVMERFDGNIDNTVINNSYYNGTPFRDYSPIREIYEYISNQHIDNIFITDKFNDSDDEYLYRIGV